MTRLVSPIYAMGEQPRPTPSEAQERRRQACADLWRQCGLVVLDPADIPNDFERQLITNMANARYGRRGRT
jgi:hypothetical protein